MFRSLCSTVTGLVALAGLAVTAACGLLPDAGPAVERMQHNAAEQGLDGEVRFLARSIGGLGTAPHVTVSG